MVIIISVPSLRKLSSDPFQRKTRVNGHPGPISGMAAADFRHDVQTDLERLLGVLQTMHLDEAVYGMLAEVLLAQTN